MKVLLVSYNPGVILQIQLTALFDSRPEILNWIAPFFGALVVVVNSGTIPTQIREIIEQRFPGAWFFVVEIDPARIDGRSAQKVWEFVNTPTSSGFRDRPTGGTLADLLKIAPKKPAGGTLADLLNIKPKKTT